MTTDFSLSLVTWDEAEDALRHIRQSVFINEQNVPADLEWDGLDQACIHVLAIDANHQPAGTARMTADGHIGRMAVLPGSRCLGIGTAMLSLLMEYARQQGLKKVKLNAQVTVKTFYEKLGFQSLGDEFMDAGIPHIRMECNL